MVKLTANHILTPNNEWDSQSGLKYRAVTKPTLVNPIQANIMKEPVQRAKQSNRANYLLLLFHTVHFDQKHFRVSGYKTD